MNLQNVYKADIASTIIPENKSPKCLSSTPEVLSIKSQYNKLTTEDRDAYYTKVQKFVLDERQKKETVVKMDKNKVVRVKKNRPKASDWYQRSAKEENIEGYFKAQA
ncbi:hypothetical protein C2G38_2026601 [Gigaspora rosea]|uniref:Uncharacterized protein n=1 Tax=Gigaspora rosea TaxID=44941 RepID=A0A397WCL2_9GLOM|nr:hypothetical protein C2G38_2026601 [Gigaspora rosea]